MIVTKTHDAGKMFLMKNPIGALFVQFIGFKTNGSISQLKSFSRLENNAQ